MSITKVSTNASLIQTVTVMSITKVRTNASLIQTVTAMSITKVNIEGYPICVEEVEMLVRDSDTDGDGSVNYQGKH